MDIERLRRDTPCKNIYMNHGSTSVPPIPVIEAVKRYYVISMEYGGTSAIAEKMVLEEYRTMRERVAELINAGSDEILFMPNGSQGIDSVIAGLPMRKGGNVVLDSVGFIAVAAPLLALRERNGVELRFVDTDANGFIDLEQLDRLVDKNTILTVVTHSPNLLGILQPLTQISVIAHKHGGLFLVNASNTVGIAAIDVKHIGCDFLSASGRKYLRGPVGSGFLYANAKAASRITPAFATWNSGVWDWSKPSWGDGSFTPYADVRRFSYGERDYSAVMGLSRAVEYLTEIGGQAAVRKRANTLLVQMMEGLLRIGAEVYGPHDTQKRAGVLGFNLPGVPFRAVTEHLNKNNIGVMGHSFFCPGVCRLFGIDGATRISLHCWNTETEIDTALLLLKALKNDR